MTHQKHSTAILSSCHSEEILSQFLTFWRSSSPLPFSNTHTPTEVLLAGKGISVGLKTHCSLPGMDWAAACFTSPTLAKTLGKELCNTTKKQLNFNSWESWPEKGWGFAKLWPERSTKEWCTGWMNCGWAAMWLACSTGLAVWITFT